MSKKMILNFWINYTMAKQIFIEKLNHFVNYLNNPIPTQYLTSIDTFDQIRQHQKNVCKLFEMILEIECHTKNIHNIDKFKQVVDSLFDNVYSYNNLFNACKNLLHIIETPDQYNLSNTNTTNYTCACYK